MDWLTHILQTATNGALIRIKKNTRHKTTCWQTDNWPLQICPGPALLYQRVNGGAGGTGLWYEAAHTDWSMLGRKLTDLNRPLLFGLLDPVFCCWVAVFRSAWPYPLLINWSTIFSTAKAIAPSIICAKSLAALSDTGRFFQNGIGRVWGSRLQQLLFYIIGARVPIASMQYALGIAKRLVFRG